jgi:hypothetical protein
MQTWIWVLIVAFGLIKIPIAGLMLWIPFRSDAALASSATEESAGDSSEEDDGGSKTVVGAGHGPHPRVGGGPHLGRGPHRNRGPHRGPHGGAAPPSPARVRTTHRSSRRSVTHVRDDR